MLNDTVKDDATDGNYHSAVTTLTQYLNGESVLWTCLIALDEDTFYIDVC